MLFPEDLPPFGVIVLEFGLAKEIRSSTDPDLPSLFNKLEDSISKFKSGNLTVITKLTARTVLGSVGDSRISKLVLEISYKNFNEDLLRQFYKQLKDSIKKIPEFDELELTVRVSTLEKIPKNGVLAVSVVFSGYSAHMQNDTRRALEDTFVNKVKKIASSIEIKPITWSIIRKKLVKDKDEETTVGGQMKYAVKNIDKKSFERIKEETIKAKPKIWDEIEIEFETIIWGID